MSASPKRCARARGGRVAEASAARCRRRAGRRSPGASAGTSAGRTITPRGTVGHDLVDAAHVRRDDRQPARHRLHQRLRHALVRVGGQAEDVEGLQPRRHVVAVAREAHAPRGRARAACSSSAARCGPSPTITSATSGRASVGDGLDEVAMALPAAQRGDDAHDQLVRRAIRVAARAAPRSPGPEAPEVDAGGHGHHARRVRRPVSSITCRRSFSPVVTMRRAWPIEPARRGVARHRRGDVARAHDRRRARRSVARRDARRATNPSSCAC